MTTTDDGRGPLRVPYDDDVVRGIDEAVDAAEDHDLVAWTEAAGRAALARDSWPDPAVMTPDFGRTAHDYRSFRAGFPARILEGLFDCGIGFADQDVVDVGTGTGSLARLLAPRVRSMRGVEPSPELLQEASELDAEAGVNVTYTVGTAEHTGLPSASADVVTAGQCWHWFDAVAATAEFARVLRPHGRLAIAHFDWVPLPGNIVETTGRLILEANPGWSMSGGTGLYPRWLTDLALGGYRDIRTFSFDVDVPYSVDAWVGRIRASAGIGGSLSAAAVTRFSNRLTESLTARCSTAEVLVPHRTWVVVARCVHGLSREGGSCPQRSAAQRGEDFPRLIPGR